MMAPELALTLLNSNDPPVGQDFLKDDMPDRIWMVVFSDKKAFYLTDEERLIFLKELAKNKIIIQIGSLTLTNKFIYMYQFKNKPVQKNYKFEGDKAWIITED